MKSQYSCAFRGCPLVNSHTVLSVASSQSDSLRDWVQRGGGNRGETWTTNRTNGRACEGGELSTPGGGKSAAARCGHAVAVQKEEAARHLSLRLVALTGARLGRPELGSGAGRVAHRPDREGRDSPAPVRL